MTAPIGRATKIIALLASLFVMVGCADPEILAEDYDQSCAVDADCALVFEGNVCACPRAGAVNQADRVRFETERSRLQAECSGGDDSCLPPPATPVCRVSTCEIR